MHAAVWLFPGAEELDVFGPFETLALAAPKAPITVELVTFDAPTLVRMAHGAMVMPERVYAGADVLIVPGGGWNRGAAAGARAEAANVRVLEGIRAAHAAGTVIAGVCTGAMIVAATGLLAGKRAITHHSALEDLRARGAIVEEDARVVDAGEVVTCGGITAGLDLALHLLDRFAGPSVAEEVAAELEYPFHRDAVRSL